MSSATIADWKKAASKEIKGKDPYEALAWHTQEVRGSGLELRRTSLSKSAG